MGFALFSGIKDFFVAATQFLPRAKNRCIHAITICYHAHVDNTFCYQTQLNNKGCHFVCYMVITNITHRTTVNSVLFLSCSPKP